MIDTSKLHPSMTLTFRCRTSFIANKYTTVKLLSISDVSMARLFTDVDAIHANIVGDIPDIGDSAEDYNYLIVELIDGTKEAVGVPWVADDIRIVSETKVVLTVPNAGPNDRDTLIKLIKSRGYAAVSAVVESK